MNQVASDLASKAGIRDFINLNRSKTIRFDQRSSFDRENECGSDA